MDNQFEHVNVEGERISAKISDDGRIDIETSDGYESSSTILSRDAAVALLCWLSEALKEKP